jgi:polyisoprenyl-teichoic acid--peptidoglycan teichoic acid transferase
MIKKYLIPIIILEAIIGIGALIFIVSAYWNTPLGSGLELSSSVPELNFNFLGTPTVDGQAVNTTPEPGKESPSVLSQFVSLMRPNRTQSNTLCGGPSSMTILLIGSDSRTAGYTAGLSDSMRLVRIDFTNPGVMMVDFPRDLWVEIPGIADHGVTNAKLNQAYLFGNPGVGYYDGPGGGAGLLARTLDQNFGVQVDHYLAMDMSTFVNFIDSIGGIDIYMDSGVDLNGGGSDPDLVFGPGTYHLDGDQALKLARNRNPSTFQRARNQDIVLSALRSKLLNPAMIPEIPNLISQFSGSVQTDLSPNEINKLLCLAEYINSDNTQMLELPENMFTSQFTYDPYRNVNTYTLSADFEQLRSSLNDFMNGTWSLP